MEKVVHITSFHHIKQIYMILIKHAIYKQIFITLLFHHVHTLILQNAIYAKTILK